MSSQSSTYKVTALVSVYNAERFLRGCLEDLVAQTLFEQTEVLIIDACSPQNEAIIAEEFCALYPNIIYERTNAREGLYASWNRALKKARGTYITNANADDRHASKALEVLAAELDAHPEIALVYANSRITAQENATFSTAPLHGRMLWPAYDPIRLLYGCCVGPQPMWRRSLHEELGYFNEDYTIAGDYDMWLRMAEHYPFKHVPKMLGLYLSHEHNLEKSNSDLLHNEEMVIYTRALQAFLTSSKAPSTPYIAQLEMQEAKLQELLAQKKAGKSVMLDHLLYIFYAKALLLAKMGRKNEALEVLQPFKDYGQAAKKLAHLAAHLTDL